MCLDYVAGIFLKAIWLLAIGGLARFTLTIGYWHSSIVTNCQKPTAKSQLPTANGQNPKRQNPE